MRGLIVLVLLALTSGAHADDDRRVGIVVQGVAGWRGRVERHLIERLRREGFTAVEAPMSRDALDTLANCFILEDLGCARGVVEARAKTPRLLHARIEEAGGTVTFDLTWFSAGSEPIPEEKACPECDRTWTAELDGMVRRLATSAPAPVFRKGELDEPEAPPSRFWPTVLITTGAATLVTGGVFLYYGLRDDESHKYIYPQLTPVGITMLAVGGGAAIGGILLLKPAGRTRSRPVAAVSTSAAYVGWAGEF